MVRLLRSMLVMMSGLAVILAFVGYAAYVHRNDTANVYVWAVDGKQRNILSFTNGETAPNLIYSAQSLPPDISANSVVVTSDGRSLVGWHDPTKTGSRTLVYGRFPGQFSNPPIDAERAYLSDDGKTVFYIAIDAHGREQTANFLDLASGQQVALTIDTNSRTSRPVLDSFSRFAIPADGWTVRNKQIVLTMFQRIRSMSRFDGYYRIDLSGINFRESGKYPLPTLARIPSDTSPSDQQSMGSLSPDGNWFAYWVRRIARGAGLITTAERVFISNLETGTVHTIELDSGEAIGNLVWSSDSSDLFYTTRLKANNIFRLHRYETTSQQSELIPLKLSEGTLSYTVPLDMTLCGTTLFFVANVNWPGLGGSYNRLISVPLDPLGESTELYTADSIDILSCAPTYAWNMSKRIQ